MAPETVLTLIGFAFVMSISPGPSNFMLLASGANFGFGRSVPLVLGISAGFLTMVLVVGLGLGQVLERVPTVYLVLRFACGAYVLWLAFKIARSRSFGPTEGDPIAAPISFLQAALFQVVNPKAWAVALIVTVTYTEPQQFLASLLIMIAVFAAINIPSISVWALAGVALRRKLSEGRRIAVFNVAMGVLLAVSTLPALFSAR